MKMLHYLSYLRHALYTMWLGSSLVRQLNPRSIDRGFKFWPFNFDV